MSAYHRQFMDWMLPIRWVVSILLVVVSTLSPAHASLNDKQNKSVSDPTTRLTQLIKLGSSGEQLDGAAQRWSCVMDANSGLTWEKRDPTSALHGHDSYHWYQPEHNTPGSPRAHLDYVLGDSTCYGFDPDNPASFCNTNAYADRVNQSNYCGYSDWRLPTAEELLTLVDVDRKKNQLAPLLDTRFFPFHDPFLYWTNTVNEDDVVVTVFADDRIMQNSERTDSILIRLVRGN